MYYGRHNLLARKLRKKKLYFARLSLIIMLTSFNRI